MKKLYDDDVKNAYITYKREGKTIEEVAKDLKPPVERETLNKRFTKLKEKDPDFVADIDEQFARVKSKKGEKKETNKESFVPKKTGETIDSTISKMVEATGRPATWFMDAMSRIGFQSMMMAMQFTKVDFRKVSQRAREFEDPNEFSDYVLDSLSALLEGVTNADALLEYKDRDKEQRVHIEFLKEMIKRKYYECNQYMDQLRMAIGMMDIRQLQQFTIANAMTNAAVAMSKHPESEIPESDEGVEK